MHLSIVDLRTSPLCSFDRYSAVKKGSWKDNALPSNGWTYDLGTHLIDQALTLFGRPESITAFIQNVRGFETDDNFIIILQYPASSERQYPFQAILRAHVLSVKTVQPRFIVRGTKGTFTKHSVDCQEDQLRAMSTIDEISKPTFGKEDEGIWGTLETLADGVVKKSMYVSDCAGHLELNLCDN